MMESISVCLAGPRDKPFRSFYIEETGFIATMRLLLLESGGLSVADTSGCLQILKKKHVLTDEDLMMNDCFIPPEPH